MKKFQIRAAQLDLARQMESMSYIRRFMDMLSENGYNAVFLYLEDRVITESYTYPASSEAYSCDEIREMVDYASKKGLEIIPCVATLGHAERFLRFPELQHIAEVRGEGRGRFGNKSKQTFCVSKPEFYEFLFSYIKEVAALFPSHYFHVGLDEFWDFNLCELCRKRAPNFQAEERMFLEHVVKVHDFLKSLGKRMAMWPDMFEHYHDILPEVPRDVIMTEWQYQPDVRFCQAHFNNQTEEETLERYRQLGFEAWVAPADRLMTNGLSILDYAQKYENATGFLMTGWEKSDTYPFRAWPIVATCGRKSAGADEETAFRAMLKQLFGTEDEIFAAAMKMALVPGFPRHFETVAEAVLLSRSTFGIDRKPAEQSRMAKVIFEHFRSKLSKGQDILDDQIPALDEIITASEMKTQLIDMLDFGKSDEKLTNLQKKFDQYLAIFRERERKWDELRPGITPNVFTVKLPGIEKRFADAKAAVENGAFLRIRTAHCDWYGMPRMRVSFRINGEFVEGFSGNFKPESIDIQMSEYFHSIDRKFLAADAVRIEHNGYGGVGVCYVALMDDGKILKVPARVLETENLVWGAEYLLTNDSRFCFLGEQNMRKVYEHQELFPVMHRIDIELKKYEVL